MNPCKIVQTTKTHRMCETCHAKWYVDSENRQAPCPFPAFARVVLDKIVAEAEARGRAAGRAEAVAELRERASEMHIKACMSGGTYTTAVLSMIQALTDAADKLEARVAAPAERQDDGGRE